MRSVPISSDPPSFVPSLFTLASQSAPKRITPSVSEGIRALCVLVCACMCETDREKGRERIKFWQREATNDPWPTFMGNSLKQKHMEWNEFRLKHYLFYYLPLPITTLFIVCFQLGGKWGFFVGPRSLFMCANTHEDKAALVEVAVKSWQTLPSLLTPTFKNAQSLICTPDLGDWPDLLKALYMPRKNGEGSKVRRKR